MPDAFLQGWRVLIVEDDYFLADDLRRRSSNTVQR